MTKADKIELIIEHIDNSNVFFDFVDSDYIDSLYSMNDNELDSELSYFESLV